MAMQPSIFRAYIDKYFKQTIGKITELFNNRKTEEKFLHETMLDEEYSADLTWNSTSLNHSVVAADVVSMNSSLPLKKRGTIRTASGDIAKVGMKLRMDEKAISDISVMRAKGQKEAQIAGKLLNNSALAIKGVKTRIEIMFQQALSNGYVLVSDEDNDGTGVRANFGYADKHIFHAKGAKWSVAASATPISDIRQMFDKANEDGDEINEVYISKAYFDLMRKTAEVKELVAAYNNQVIINADNLPQPGSNKTLEALGDEFGATFHIVGGSYKYERPDGSQVSVKPWAQGNIVGVPSAKVGRLVYGTLAEDTSRVAGVNYEKSGYILVSQYSHNEPALEEITAAQALAMPVIDDGQSIYVLHADSTGTLEIEPETLNFTASAGTKRVTAHSDDEAVSASTVAEWLTVSAAGNVVTVKAAANSGVERNATVTVTAGELTKTLNVVQAGA